MLKQISIRPYEAIADFDMSVESIKTETGETVRRRDLSFKIGDRIYNAKCWRIIGNGEDKIVISTNTKKIGQ